MQLTAATTKFGHYKRGGQINGVGDRQDRLGFCRLLLLTPHATCHDDICCVEQTQNNGKTQPQTIDQITVGITDRIATPVPTESNRRLRFEWSDYASCVRLDVFQLGHVVCLFDSGQDTTVRGQITQL